MAARAIVGGLMSGVGGGMIAQAEDRRQEALERARELRRSMEREDDRAFTLRRDADQREHQLTDRAEQRDYEGGLIRNLDVNDQGGVVGITATGDVKELDYNRNQGLIDRGRRTGAGADTGGMSAGDKRIYDAAVKRETKKTDGVERTDWAAVAKRLEQQGRPDLAQFAAPMEGGGPDIESPEWLEAGRQAREWVDRQAGWFRRDSTDFKEFGGNRSEAFRQKQMEFYGELTGKQVGSRPQEPGRGQVQRPEQERPADDRGPEAQQGMDAGKPPGAGTQANPYKATEQAQIDWFRQHAPAGAIIEVAGQLYAKE